MVALHLGSDRLAQRRRAGHGGVLGVVGVDRLDRRLFDMVGRREVGLAGGQADHIFARRFHLQELALRGIGRRGLDAAETIGDESHDGGASFQAFEKARGKYWWDPCSASKQACSAISVGSAVFSLGLSVIV